MASPCWPRLSLAVPGSCNAEGRQLLRLQGMLTVASLPSLLICVSGAALEGSLLYSTASPGNPFLVTHHEASSCPEGRFPFFTFARCSSIHIDPEPGRQPCSRPIRFLLCAASHVGCSSLRCCSVLPQCSVGQSDHWRPQHSPTSLLPFSFCMGSAAIEQLWSHMQKKNTSQKQRPHLQVLAQLCKPDTSGCPSSRLALN